MVQRPKTEIREAILRAAAAAFAQDGFEGASLGDIVERAGTSIGNLYKYFGNKEELFAKFMPQEFTADLTNRVRSQVGALRTEPDAFSLDKDHPYWRASDALLAFTLEHRERVVFLLLRAQRTKHERFASEIVRLLVALALEHARANHASFAASAANKRALTRIYTAFVASLGTILVEERSEAAVREAVALHTTYHLSGLQALFERQGVVAAGGPSQ
jgi:AcrR family transcriptional regulator